MEKKFTRLTLEDISREIHISRTTIYKVINQKGTVNEQTRNAVLEALKKYHYVPNNNARNLALNRQYEIGFIGFESPDASYFAPTIELGIHQAITDYGDHGLTVQSFVSPVNNPLQQEQNIQKAYDNGIRHFVISAIDTEHLKPLIRQLKENGCTVILLSKEISDVPYDTFIGIDDYKSGQLSAEVLGHMMPAGSSLQILVAKKSLSNLSSTQRKLEGFLAQMKLQFPHIHILPIQKHLSNTGMIREVMLKTLEIPNMTGIYDLTYKLDILSDVLRRENRRDVALVGMDFFPEIQDALADHTIDAIIFQDLQAQAYLACRLLFEQMCYGKAIERTHYYSKLEIVMSSNMDYFQNSSRHSPLSFTAEDEANLNKKSKSRGKQP